MKKLQHAADNVTRVLHNWMLKSMFTLKAFLIFCGINSASSMVISRCDY